MAGIVRLWKKFPSKYGKAGIIVLVLALAVVMPWITSKYNVRILTLAMAWAIAALSLNLILGYTGQASLAHGALMGIGAYAFGIFAERVGLNFWLALPIACLVTAFIGLLIGLPSLRTKGPYFAIVTLCFNVIVYKVFENWQWLSGGIQGQVVPQPSFLQQRWARYYFVLGCLLLTLIVMHFIVKSLLGLTFMSIRSNENLAEATGINTFRNKLLSFVVSCFFVGLAGSMLAIENGQLDPTITIHLNSFYILIFLLIGGAATLSGPLVGAIGLYWLLDYMKKIGIKGIEEFRYLFFGLILIIVIIYMPRGLVGGLKQLWEWMKSRLKRRKIGEVPE
ncbi:MAG: branched-chain amino acid ABC transporter permease [Actinomycetota bacterium]|nr:branched-chain amino acid ABC transporter permease [Actinomycetota bacterium]MDD5666149.1 branched-chain amino acid ABC transporter permease [Actinomycetota bacterium]